MASSDDDSELSEAPTTVINPFTIAARSSASTKVARQTRNVQIGKQYIRDPMVFPKKKKRTSIA